MPIRPSHVDRGKLEPRNATRKAYAARIDLGHRLQRGPTIVETREVTKAMGAFDRFIKGRICLFGVYPASLNQLL